MRKEKDSLGEVWVPEDAYYGIFTQRAKENFQISGLRAHPTFIKSILIIKKACALTNMNLGNLDEKIGRAIAEASDEIINGRYLDQFVLDVFQAGAGTPFNMNANEVIANIAIEKLGGSKGEYSLVHPNNHVNMAQSSNDVIPTAIRIASLLLLEGLNSEIKQLEESFSRIARENEDVVKVGRTHLMDAVPIRYGQVFGSIATSLKKSLERHARAKDSLLELGIGGTAVGTGINTHPGFRETVVEKLRGITGYSFRPTRDPVELTWSMASFVELSSSLRTFAIELNKISDDLRLLSSGPKAGIAEIILPEVEPGSSIMPGKINPSIPEAANMVCYQVIGNDHAVAQACQAGQFELNVMTPLIAFNLIWSIELLKNTVKMLREKCVDGIIVNTERCIDLLEKSLSLATVLNPYIGYDQAAELVKKALKENKTLRQVVLEEKIIPEEYLAEILDPKKMTGPRTIDPELIRRIKRKKK